MFIKWHTYQRQMHGKKIDKFIHQAIITESYRRSKPRLKREWVGTPWEGALDKVFASEEFKHRDKRSRHSYVYKLPAYPACMVVYFNDPHWQAQREEWWQAVDTILEKLAAARDDMPSTVVDKLKADLEEAVPRVTTET
jgi:hypothetical protein